MIQTSQADYDYWRLVTKVLGRGDWVPTRPGIDAVSLFGVSISFDLQLGFPLLTTKKVYWKGVYAELLWFLRGETNIKPLIDQGVNIWNEWADENGDLGPVYGSQWRSWQGANGKVHDQIQNVLDGLREDPNSRRHIVSAWNVGELDDMALPPCHLLMQFMARNGQLHCQVYQRSQDLFLGAPFNYASYALLTHLMATTLDLDPGTLRFAIGDAHIYENHIPQITTQILRDPFPAPTLEVTHRRERLEDYQPEDFKLVNYQHHPAIKGEVAV